MTSDEVAAVLDQIAALSPAEEPLAMPSQGFSLQRNRAIELPAPPAVARALTLQVEVELVVPRVWRQVAVRGDLTLKDLHAVIHPDAPAAVCTDGGMAGPLEDSGGPPGYSELVEAFSDEPPLGRSRTMSESGCPRGGTRRRLTWARSTRPSS